MTRVYAFGTFDGVHPGHRSFLRQAKALGDHLTVIIARDANVRRRKAGSVRGEEERRQLVVALGIADDARLGDQDDSYRLLTEEPIDVICLGYDQFRNEQELMSVLRRAGKAQVRVVRAKAFFPWLFRGRFLRFLGLLGKPSTPENVENHS